MKWMDLLRERFTRVHPLPPATLAYQALPGDEPAYRLHLRLNPDGSGLLIVNAATVLHLNPTAAEYAFHLVKGTPPEVAAREVTRRYRVRRETALRDFLDFRERIRALIYTPDLDPVTFLDFERVAPHSAELTAPLRLDCALTYRLPASAPAGDAPVERVERELSTEEWKTVLDKAWAYGVPHVIFTGGEPTLREDLPELIAHAEKNGQVTGLLTDGLKLADRPYLNALLQTGLDHLLFLLQPEKEASWQALATVMPEDIFVTVHLTLTLENVQKGNEILERLVSLGAQNLSLSAADASLQEAMQSLRNRAAELGLTLRWDLPVPYSAHNPASLEVVDEELPQGAGRVWLYIEPDGDVLPAQGEPDKVLGNVLRDPWEKIYPRT